MSNTDSLIERVCVNEPYSLKDASGPADLRDGVTATDSDVEFLAPSKT